MCFLALTLSIFHKNPISLSLIPNKMATTLAAKVSRRFFRPPSFSYITTAAQTKSPLSSTPYSQFTAIRHQSDWTPPKIASLIPYDRRLLDIGFWICLMEKSVFTNRIDLDSPDDVFDYSVEILAPILGSEEEAKRKIYALFSTKSYFGFGAEIDKAVADKVKALPGMRKVEQDFHILGRRKHLINRMGNLEWIGKDIMETEG